MGEHNVASQFSRKNTRPTGSVLPDSAWSWLIISGNAVMGITTLGFFRCLPVFYLAFMTEYDVLYGDVALISGLFCCGLAAGSFFLPYLTTKYGQRKTAFATGLSLGSSVVISSFSPYFLIIQIFLGFLSGCCSGILWFTALVTSNQYVVKRRSLATGIATLGVPLGALALAPIMGILLEQFGWRGALLITSGFLFNACVSASLYRPLHRPSALPFTSEALLDIKGQHDHPIGLDDCVESSRKEGDVQQREKDDAALSDVILQKPSCCLALKSKTEAFIDISMFRSLSFDMALLSTAFYFCGYISGNTFMIPLGTDRVGLTSVQASSVLSVASGAECISKIVHGFLTDLDCVNRIIHLCITCVLFAVFLAVMPLGDDFASLAGLAFGYGCMSSAYVGVMAVVYADVVGTKNITKAIGYQGCLYNCMLGPCLYLMGRLVDNAGDIRIPFYLSSGLIAAAGMCLVAVYWLERQKRASKSQSGE